MGGVFETPLGLHWVSNGMALGMYRSAQIGIGAAASALVGLVAEATGLRPTLAVAMLVPLALLWICRGR